MKKGILIAVVLLICTSTVFSQSLACTAKVTLEYLQNIYSLYKNEKPEYESVIAKIAKACVESNYTNTVAAIEASTLVSLFQQIASLDGKIAKTADFTKQHQKATMNCMFE